MSKRVILLLTAGLLILTVIIFWVNRNNFQNPEIHYHAGFKVFVNGYQQDFSEDRYMNFTLCTLRGKSENNQLEKAHLHDNTGDVVHVHRKGAVWGDLFTNINYSFPPNVPVIGYINHRKIENILAYPIKPYDSVIIVAGDASNIDLNAYVTLNQIRETEKKSETCGS
jgi:hypothetical protein